jgi:signal transduction histidine kinase
VEIRPFSRERLPVVARAVGPAADPGGVVLQTELERSGRRWGRLLVALPAGTQLSPRDQVLVAGVAEHVTTILQTTALRNALRGTVAEAEVRAGDLRRSRQRILLTSHEGRRRVERDIHDGAQQHLVALAVYLGLVRSLVADRPSALSAAIETARSSARSALAALDELSSGLYPARLAEEGLHVALEQAARTAPPPVVVVSVDDLPRADLDVEAAVYFCCLEAVQNASKHARASGIGVRLGFRESALTFAVTDDGDGFVPSAALAGTGMQNMRDRLEALAGSLVVASAPGAGTTVSGRVPAHPR